jgi:DNA topoisomerase IB
MKLKDFRTILATRWAKEELEKEFAEYMKHDYRWSKPEQIKKMIMAASKRVAKKLHNTPSVARSSYIHPEIIEQFISQVNE